MHSRPSLSHHTNGDQSLTIEWNFLAAIFVLSLIGAVPDGSEAALCRTLGVRVAASSSKLLVGNMLIGDGTVMQEMRSVSNMSETASVSHNVLLLLLRSVVWLRHLRSCQ
jgi:hypothetical protein